MQKICVLVCVSLCVCVCMCVHMCTYDNDNVCGKVGLHESTKVFECRETARGHVCEDVCEYRFVCAS